MRRAALAPVLVALLLRLAAAVAFDRVTADVERYERVARHLLDVSWNPYTTVRLYPYPPPWAAVEAAALWLARAGVASFAVNVKLPVLLADLAIVALLAGAAARGAASPLAAWLYALHPVAVLVGAVHGQFDAIPLFFLLLAVLWSEQGRSTPAALALAAGIAVKSFPVLALPFLALAASRSWRGVLRFAALALVPCALLLLPFAALDARALGRELFGYGGIADFGWTSLARGLEWLAGSPLPRSEARFWPAAAVASRTLFLAAWLALVLAARAGRLALPPSRAVLAALLAFAALYGLQSAQYLLWVVPIALLRPDRLAAAHAVAATTGLVGFYAFLAPGVLLPTALDGRAWAAAGFVWLAGSAATLAVCAFWLARTLADAFAFSLRARSGRV